jgi:hypothetical protein
LDVYKNYRIYVPYNKTNYASIDEMLKAYLAGKSYYKIQMICLDKDGNEIGIRFGMDLKKVENPDEIKKESKVDEILVYIPVPPPATNLPLPKAGTVYVVGSEHTSMNSRTAILWIDGTPYVLSANGGLSSVFVTKDNIIYVEGYENDSATLWKIEKGKVAKTRLSDDSIFVAGTAVPKMELSSVNGMEASSYASWISPDGKVYEAGRTGNPEFDYECYATLWINGKGQMLPGGKYGSADAIYGTEEGDIYISGITRTKKNDEWYTTPVIWKNQTIQALDKAIKDWECGVEALFVTGSGDVYAGGYIRYDDRNHAVIWKNGTKQLLDDGSQVASIYVTPEGDVYVTGGSYANPRIWKNGIRQTLTHINAKEGAYLSGIFVK